MKGAVRRLLRKRIAFWVMGVVLSALPLRGAQCGPTAFDCGVYHLSRKEFAQAIRYLEQSLAESPRNVKALNLLGISLTATGQIDKANDSFRKALRIDPRFYPALKNLAINEVNMKRTAEAKGHFEKVLTYAPDDEVSHLYLAEIFDMEKMCVQALPHYEKSRNRVVNDSDLILQYAFCSLDQNRPDPAVTMLDLLPAGDALAQFHAGEMLAKAGVYKDAAKHFGLSRPAYPDPYVAGYNQVLMLLKGDDYHGAIRVGQELIAQGYKHSELYRLISEAYLGNGKIREAYDALKMATQISPKEEDNYIDLVAICLDYENYDLGLEITEIGLQHIPNSDRLYLQRGVMRAMKGQVAESEKDFQAAHRLAPQKTLPYVALGIAWMQLGLFEKAVGALREQAKLKPNDYLIEYLLGEALMRSGLAPGSETESEAIKAFEASVRANPEFVHSRAELGKLLLRRGEVDRAIEELEKAVELDPTDASPAFQLGQAYRRKGDSARAQEMMIRVDKLHKTELKDDMAKALKRIVKTAAPGLTGTRSKP
jgi:tetratricopeptide (TPR) repeat protein